MKLFFILSVCFGFFSVAEAGNIQFKCDSEGKIAVTTSAGCIEKAKEFFSKDCCFTSAAVQILDSKKKPWGCTLKEEGAKCVIKKDSFYLDTPSEWVCSIPSDCSELDPVVGYSNPPTYNCLSSGSEPFYKYLNQKKGWGSVDDEKTDKVLTAVYCKERAVPASPKLGDKSSAEASSSAK